MFVQSGAWLCFKAKNYWLVTDTLIRSEMFRPDRVGGGGGGGGQGKQGESC